MTKIGVGHGNNRDSLELGEEVARMAIGSSGIHHPDLLLAFCHRSVDHDQFFSGLRNVVGLETPIVGGSSVGVITDDYLSYHDSPAAVAAVESDSLRFSTASAEGVDRDSTAAGRNLVDGLPRSDDDRLLLIFYDSILQAATSQTPPIMNSSAPLLKGIDDRLAGRVPVAGAGLIGDFGFGTTRQFCGSHVSSQCVVGCMVSGSVTAYSSIMHGCVLLDGVYRKITRMAGNIIYEFDGEPVVPLLNRIFGSESWQEDRPVLKDLTIGINRGERYGEPREDNYINRLIIGVTPDKAGIAMFEADLSEGEDIQFLTRENRRMMASVRQNAPALVERVRSEGKKPLLAFYIDCGGRTAEQSSMLEEEAAEVQRVMKGNGIPLLGMYSGVEIAPTPGSSRGLDWTGVLLILATAQQ